MSPQPEHEWRDRVRLAAMLDHINRIATAVGSTPFEIQTPDDVSAYEVLRRLAIVTGAVEAAASQGKRP